MLIYIETNFLIGHASGQDPDALRLIEFCRDGGRLAIPSVCIMEAFSVVEQEDRRVQRLIRELRQHGSSVRREKTRPGSQNLITSLERTEIELQAGLARFRSRIFEMMEQVSLTAELLPVTRAILTASRSSEFIEDPTDNLILLTILDHAANTTGVDLAFLSANIRDFGRNTDVAERLHLANIRYFRDTLPLLGWARAAGSP